MDGPNGGSRPVHKVDGPNQGHKLKQVHKMDKPPPRVKTIVHNVDGPDKGKNLNIRKVDGPSIKTHVHDMDEPNKVKTQVHNVDEPN